MTEDVKLPELPKLPGIAARVDLSYDEFCTLLRDYARQAVLAERERAAKVADERASECKDEFASDGDERWLVYAKHAERIAAAIRSGT